MHIRITDFGTAKVLSSDNKKGADIFHSYSSTINSGGGEINIYTNNNKQCVITVVCVNLCLTLELSRWIETITTDN